MMNQQDRSSTLDELLARHSPQWMLLEGVEAVGVGDNSLKIYVSFVSDEIEKIPDQIEAIRIEKILSGRFGRQ